jgi:hypothetical protein
LQHIVQPSQERPATRSTTSALLAVATFDPWSLDSLVIAEPASL